MGILFGSLTGLLCQKLFSNRHQNQIRVLLGLLTILAGGRLMWSGLNGSFKLEAKELLFALLAIMLGNWLGRLLALQKISNQLGRYASGMIAAAQKNPPGRGKSGFLMATILFCAAPLGLIGAVTEGTSNNFDLLLIKAIMDGLAAAVFVKVFNWGAAMSSIPIYLFFGGITFLARQASLSYLAGAGMILSMNITAGLLACIIALVILEVRKVDLANYLPALVAAPLLTKWLG